MLRVDKKQVSAKEQVRSHEDKSQSQSDKKIFIATWHEGSTSTSTTTTTTPATATTTTTTTNNNNNHHMEGNMLNQHEVELTHFIEPDSALEAQLVSPRMGKAIPTKVGSKGNKESDPWDENQVFNGL